MSAAHVSPRRLVLGTVALSLVLSACAGQREPTKFSGSVRDNWMAGCTAPAGDKSQGLSTTTCGCIYDQVEKKMDFSDFAGANNDRREQPSVLKGPGWDEAYKACGVTVGGGYPPKETTKTTVTSGETTTTTSLTTTTGAPAPATSTSAG